MKTRILKSIFSAFFAFFYCFNTLSAQEVIYDIVLKKHEIVHGSWSLFCSENILPENQDGWIEYIVDNGTPPFAVGFNLIEGDPINPPYMFDATPSDNFMDIRDNVTPSGKYDEYSRPVSNTKLKIERKSGNINYYIDDVLEFSAPALSDGLRANLSYPANPPTFISIKTSIPRYYIPDDCDPDPTAGTMGFHVASDGTIKVDNYLFAREILVTMCPFPDYVFARNYDLMPLGELKKYIEKYQHLPNIPSAETVRENNIGLGELSRKQMEKIEELTLYLIQMDERMKKLEIENERLRKAIDSEER